MNEKATALVAEMGLYKKLSSLSSQATYMRIGRLFSQEPLVAAERDELGAMLAGIHRFKVGECYMNAYKIAMAQKSLNFCEGIAAGYWGVEHAWNVYKGRAIDVTWPMTWSKGRSQIDARYTPSDKAEAIMKRVVNNLRHCAYWGVEVPSDVIRNHCLQYQRYTPLFDPQFFKQWPKFEKQIVGGVHEERIDSVAG
jgi:hypothetical protein